MLRRLKLCLFAVALAGLIIDGGYYAYCKFGADIASSNIVKQLGGD